MKLNKRPFDRFIYIILCLLSFGMTAILRIVISEAISHAIKEDT